MAEGWALVWRNFPLGGFFAAHQVIEAIAVSFQGERGAANLSLWFFEGCF